MQLLKLLSNNGFISYNKTVAKKLGVDEAILLGELCSIADKFDYEEFYFEREKIINDTSLSDSRIRNATKRLAQAGLINVEKKGLPCKYYYKLNELEILSLFDDELVNRLKSSATNFEAQVIIKNNNQCLKNESTGALKNEALYNKNTENKNTKVIKEKNIVKKERFTPPKLEEVEAYIKEKKFTATKAIDFFEYYEMKGWRVGNSPMKNWQMALNRWERKNKERNNNATFFKTTHTNRNKGTYNDPDYFDDPDAPF